MFTPPASPLPPRTLVRKEPSLPPSEEEEEPEDDSSVLEYVPYPDRPTPTLASPSKFARSQDLSPTSPLSAWNYTPKQKSSRRRIVIPLLAVLLLIVSVASRWTPTRRVAQLWEAPPPSPHVGPLAPPSNKRHQSWTRHLRKQKRQPDAADLTPTPVAGAAASPSGSGILATISTNGTSPSIPDPPYPVPTPFPQAFDTTFSYNFSTSSCQSFFATSLLSNLTFRQCRPFSLLLSASNQFFNDQTNLTLLTSIIGGTCATTPTVDACLATMSYFATEIQKDTVCGKDLSDRNAIALEALNGFMNYGFMRQAGCLINQRTNSYCFVDAVAAYPPSDIYFYQLALGIALSNKTTPSCSTCAESLLNIYAAQASNSSLDISRTYPKAADKAIAACGAKYATSMDVTSGSEMRLVVPCLWAVVAVMAAIGLGVV